MTRVGTHISTVISIDLINDNLVTRQYNDYYCTEYYRYIFILYVYILYFVNIVTLRSRSIDVRRITTHHVWNRCFLSRALAGSFGSEFWISVLLYTYI